MKLDFMEEFSGSNGHTIVKRKRLKRQRPSSSASSNGGTDFCNSSPTTSTEQDQDMANCLILLARGNSPQQPQDAITSAPDTKFTTRKFTAMAAGKLGIYVYECKTCNRIFPSFQALGGHRASHKKPKTTTDDDRKRPPPSAAALGCPDVAEQRLSPPNSPQFLAGICRNDQNKPRIHECSICGSEFGSGQALGGHMRRHRPAGSSTENDTTSSDDVGVKARNMLALDLNLPAPVDEEFGQFPAKQQPRLVFSAAPLVGCHY